jgi:hypothetical protein
MKTRTAATDAKLSDYFNTGYLKQVFNDRLSTSRNAGSDGVTAEQFSRQLDKEIQIIRRKVLSGTYRFSRYKQKLIPKGAKKLPRELSIPTVRDRLVLRCLLAYLSVKFPDSLPRRPHVYVAQIKMALESSTEDLSFVRMDIKEYYPSINHEILMKKIKRRIRNKPALALISNAIQTSSTRGLSNACGVPQGLCISNILGNLYLTDFDTAQTRMQGQLYFRYVDDILAVVPSERAASLFKSMSDTLGTFGLSTHDLSADKGKSSVCSTVDGIEYLGFSIKPDRISVRASSLQKMFDTLSAIITQGKHTGQLEKMFWRLNLRVTGCILNGKRYGWLFFFLQTNDLTQLERLDSFLQRQVVRNPGLKLPVKSFVRSYFEIRYNMSNTSYIPKFDVFDRKDRGKVVSMLGKASPQMVEGMTDVELDDHFVRLVKKEVAKLEKDLQEATS